MMFGEDYKEEYYVIQTKDEFKKFPVDKRNRIIYDEYDDFGKKMLTTMNIYETYFYLDPELAIDDIKYYGLDPEKFEVQKYEFAYRVVPDSKVYGKE